MNIEARIDNFTKKADRVMEKIIASNFFFIFEAISIIIGAIKHKEKRKYMFDDLWKEWYFEDLFYDHRTADIKSFSRTRYNIQMDHKKMAEVQYYRVLWTEQYINFIKRNSDKRFLLSITNDIADLGISNNTDYIIRFLSEDERNVYIEPNDVVYFHTNNKHLATEAALLFS